MTLDGIPVELVVAPPAAFGTALVRATGSAEYVAALGPLPDAPDEEGVYAALGLAVRCRRSCASGALERRAARARRARARSAATCTATRPGRTARRPCSRWATRGPRARLRVPRDLRPHAERRASSPGLDADALRRQAEEIAAANERARAVPGAARHRVRHPRRRLARPARTTCSPSSSGCSSRCIAGQRAPRRELTARVIEAMRHPAVRCLSHPTGRLIGHRPENALDLERTIEVALETGVALEVNGLAEPARPERRARPRRRSRPACAIVCSTDAHSTAGLGYMPLSVHTARRGGATCAMC